MTRQDQGLCAYCGNEPGTEEHHLIKRSLAPELKDDPKNKVRLCWKCHRRTEEDMAFQQGLIEIFTFRPINLEMFTRAQASISALLDGKDISFLTPAMVDHYLQLASAGYSHFSERMGQLEQEYAPFFLARNEEKNNKEIEMEWLCTPAGREMNTIKRKLKSLEKIMSNLRARMKRLEMEYFNSK